MLCNDRFVTGSNQTFLFYNKCSGLFSLDMSLDILYKLILHGLYSERKEYLQISLIAFNASELSLGAITLIKMERQSGRFDR